ncbi:L-glyceraldehyde 3-phosphate reductase [Lacrimispora sphenoides]|jgi:L-glyceraldehyde 3-phosphate reductase|uniref:aldo/keto reductase n=1 Tax=Lacrimispora sphenoides TaxID=29370 RepID=UPI00044B2F8F|nr:aldo/keto reductase [Lacrimispora sphenoides]EXG84577.1 putative oxidoreductase, aryl-alcohol dehydrogenase like protein [Clostridium sp. ASBs410]SET69338.1 L-glyceraldehyde 3-phosphate reductase [Lacrimispora sphenoides]
MYQAAEDRYEKMEYKRCGRSGVLLPMVSLGLWQNFGMEKPLQEQREILLRAFDMGITHFDLANNYGSPALGKAEENFGEILKSDLGKYRDELLISTKAGFDMWPGPYGNWGSRKYLMASLDQSLKRMGLEYVDIFYHHRPDPGTPLEETMGALADIVRQGKALYVGISNYGDQEARDAVLMLKEMGVPCLIDQPRYNMFERGAEDGLFSTLLENGVGCICYSPLAQGALTDKYLKGIPQESRAARQGTTVGGRYLSEEKLDQIRQLNELALERGQTLARMALSWVLREEAVTSVLIGASSVKQLEDSAACLDNHKFTQEELDKIDSILK